MQKVKVKGGKQKKMEVVKVIRNEYVEICPKCGKRIKGSSPASATNNLKVHLLTQHSAEQK